MNQEAEIIAAVVEKFPTFGGGRVVADNPIAYALQDRPAMFAAAVPVADVVRFVLQYRLVLERERVG